MSAYQRMSGQMDPLDAPFHPLEVRQAGASVATHQIPYTTVTKTLFSTGLVTSTSSSESSSAGTSQTLYPVSPMFGFNHIQSMSTTTSISIVYRYHTVTATSVSTTSIVPTVASSDTTTVVSSTSHSASGTLEANTTSATAPASQPGKIAGSVIGSMAAFSMLGFLLWYFCLKKQGKTKLKLAMSLRRKNSDIKTPQIEGQSLERTRTILLQKAEQSKSREHDINSFLTTSVEQYSSHDQAVSRLRSPVDAVKQSWIGVAMTSSTPPDTPPLPRSNSQKSDRTGTSTGQSPSTAHKNHTAFVDRESTRASLIPEPLKPGLKSNIQKPAPIITVPQLQQQSNVSPLSPRAMLNVMSATTSRAWRRASKALSPSSYQRLEDSDRRRSDTSQLARPPRRPSRNPELNIGPQTDGGWNGQWL